MKYIYTAIFHENPDGSYTIIYPDLPGCISEGKSFENAIYIAQSALTEWINYLIDEKKDIPKASAFQDVKTEQGEFKNLICVLVKNTKAAA